MEMYLSETFTIYMTQASREGPEGTSGRGTAVGSPAQERLAATQVSAGTQHLDTQWMSSVDFCASLWHSAGISCKIRISFWKVDLE